MGRDNYMYLDIGWDKEVNPLLIRNASLTYACCLQLKPVLAGAVNRIEQNNI